ncbi:hypothetical protein Cflav_PD6022 [Pedosphaera parvula Ellin514]|uniref:Uncharacterized protein n=1 Tax=Pedosphaera parvula (strain Ellin514) TaxID=320771 RepID=B9XA46_PEDPL|nr:hypothetical protein Cflav_PD6022 [Pedosphaera parvula Ellin514]
MNTKGNVKDTQYYQGNGNDLAESGKSQIQGSIPVRVAT